MKYLLDTCVISELTKPRPSPKVVEWLKTQDPSCLYLSYLTIGELQKGIAKRGGDIRAKRLESWLANVIFAQYKDRIVPIAKDESLIWGNECGTAERGGKRFPVINSLIAATAISHGMTLVTRNVEDVFYMNVPIFNPFGD